MSGMCERSAFDTFYHMDNDEKGLVTFYGFESSIIRYDTKQRLWVLTIINKPDLICPPEKTQHPSLVTSLFSDSINSRGWDICQADICHPQLSHICHPRIRPFANLKNHTFARPTIATPNCFSFTGALLFWLRFSGVSSFH